jgi:hypothetical protein
MSKWTASDTPGEIHVMLDGVDKSLLYRTIRECRQVIENLMNVLYLPVSGLEAGLGLGQDNRVF